MLGLICIRPFCGLRDGSQNPEEFLDDVECAADMFEAHWNPSSATGLEKSCCRFFRQYLADDSDAEYWWQYVMPTDEKKIFEKLSLGLPRDMEMPALGRWQQETNSKYRTKSCPFSKNHMKASPNTFE